MNTPNPLIPQGTLASSRGASNLRIAVVTIAAIHVVFFGGLLLQGCKPDKKLEANNAATNAEPSTAASSATPSGYGPIDPTNALYYSNSSGLPANASASPAAPAPGGTRPQDQTASPGSVLTPDAGLASSGATRPGETKDYTVVKNDSFYKIAKQHGITMAALTRANQSLDPAKLKVGAKITIPAPEAAAAKPADSGMAPDGSQLYVVKSGDNLIRVASQHGVSVSELRSANGLRTSGLRVGQKLKIPAKSAAAAAASTNSVSR